MRRCNPFRQWSKGDNLYRILSVNKMGEGGLSLEELLKEYELGVKLSQELNVDLEMAQAKLLTLQGGVLKPMDNLDGV